MEAKYSKWRKLDNAALAFPMVTGKDDTRVFRFYCELKETVDEATLQEALDQTMKTYPLFQADMLNAPVNRPACIESTAMGAAYLAGLAVGYWQSKEDVIKNQQLDHVFVPNIDPVEREAKRKGWNKAVKYAYGWAKNEEEEEE